LHNFLNDPSNAVEALTRAISMQGKGIYFFERAKAYYSLKNINASKADVANAQNAGHQVSQELINQLSNLQ
jgi:hypothetical protein